MSCRNSVTILTLINSPVSLKELCIHKVCELLFILNEHGFDSQFIWLDKNRNPFLGIQAWVIEEILKCFMSFLGRKNVFFRYELLQILYCKKFQSIDLTNFRIKQDDLLDILKIVKCTKSDLTFFGLFRRTASCFKPSAFTRVCFQEFLSGFISTMTSLTHLMVDDICNDNLLEVIAASCPNLVVLEAKSLEVTSKGLKSLQENQRCQKLEEIYLFSDLDLSEGVEILLRNLPCLHVIENVDTEVRNALIKLNKESNDYTSKLKKVPYTCQQWPYSLIVKTCPLLSEISIENSSPEKLVELGSLKHLKTLHIRNQSNFELEITPFLKKVGKTVESLWISTCEKINVNIIKECCPCLRNLACVMCSNYSDRILKAPMFLELEQLILSPTSDLDIDDCVNFISCCPKLRTLQLVCYQEFTKDHLKEILLNNPLEYLKSVRIKSTCLNIGGNVTGGDILMNL